MQRVHSELADLPHETIVQRAVGVWPSLDQAIKEYAIDLIVSGTHGRTGAQKLLLGSVAEEIFRRSRVPVLTIGPWAWTNVHNGAKFRRVLFATDFTRESLAAAPYAISMAQENQARLFLIHVMGKADNQGVAAKTAEESFADAVRRLHEIVPPDAELSVSPGSPCGVRESRRTNSRGRQGSGRRLDRAGRAQRRGPPWSGDASGAHNGTSDCRARLMPCPHGSRIS